MSSGAVRWLASAVRISLGGTWWNGLFVVVFVAMCGWPVLGGLDALQESAELDLRGLPAEAIVLEVENKSVDQWDWTDITVAYTDAAGVSRRAMQNGQASTRVNDRLRITYDPLHPGHVRWPGSSDFRIDTMFGGIFIFVVGAAVGVAEAVKSWRKGVPDPALDEARA